MIDELCQGGLKVLGSFRGFAQLAQCLRQEVLTQLPLWAGSFRILQGQLPSFSALYTS